MKMFDKSDWDKLSDYEMKALEEYILDLLKQVDSENQVNEDIRLRLRALLYELQLFMIARMN